MIVALICISIAFSAGYIFGGLMSNSGYQNGFSRGLNLGREIFSDVVNDCHIETTKEIVNVLKNLRERYEQQARDAVKNRT